MWERCLRLQKTFHYKMYFPLPQETITRILFCKNLPEAEFLCYRKVITDTDIESQQKRGFAGREEDCVSRRALLLILTSEVQPWCAALWKTFTLPQVPPIRGSKPRITATPAFASSVFQAPLSEREGSEKGMKLESGKDSSRGEASGISGPRCSNVQRPVWACLEKHPLGRILSRLFWLRNWSHFQQHDSKESFVLPLAAKIAKQ